MSNKDRVFVKQRSNKKLYIITTLKQKLNYNLTWTTVPKT
ncbi:hypothetical protein EON70_00445 [bacterium]|nr:MAG: hypothetical protein EON70_00445 [bacterium]